MITINSNILTKALSNVIGTVQKSTVNEYSGSLLFKIQDNVISIITNNGEQITEAFIKEFNGSIETFCVDAYAFFEIVKKMQKDGDITIENAKNNELDIIKISQRKFVGEIACLKPEYFSIDERSAGGVVFSINRQKLVNAMDKTKAFMYATETRYNINGTLFKFSIQEKRLNLVATDGYRLAHAFIELESIDKDISITVPRKVIFEIRKILSNETCEVVKLHIPEGAKNIKVETEFCITTTKLVDATFPDYARVIPQNYEHYFEVNTKSFLYSIDKVSSILTTSEFGVKCEVSSSILKISSTRDINKLLDEISCTFTSENEFTFNANFTYLKDILSCISSDEVRFYIGDFQKPLLIKNKEDNTYQAVLVPMKA